MLKEIDTEQWYVHVDGEPRGPLGIRDLDVLLRTNEITSKTLGWKVGMANWKPLIEIQDIRDSIKQSSNEIIEISQKKTTLFDKKSKRECYVETVVEEKPQQAAEVKEDAIVNEQQQEDEEDPLAILAATVENIVKNSFHQSEDGKWNIYNEEKQQWHTQAEQPKEQIEQMKNALLTKLKAQLFSTKKEPKRRRENTQPKEAVALTKEELEKKERNRKKTKRAAEKKKQKWYNPKINTFIYISGLPPDINEEELKEFASKAGVIRIDLRTGKEKIKIYRDDSGIPKGDAAISYAKEESITIALEMLNERQIKPGFQVKIERAQFNQKNQEYKPRDSKKINKVNKVLAKKYEQRQLNWDEEDATDGLKIVIMKNMFTPDQLQNEALLLQTKEDIKTECQKIGPIQRIRFYETHPEGVVEVKFKEESAAEKCIEIMNGRFFDEREIECAYWDGETNYKASVGTQMIEKGQIQQFGNWLEQQADSVMEGQPPEVKITQLTLEDLQAQPTESKPSELTESQQKGQEQTQPKST